MQLRIAGWAPPASLEQHGVSQHVSQQEFCHRAGLQPKDLIQREGQRL